MIYREYTNKENTDMKRAINKVIVMALAFVLSLSALSAIPSHISEIEEVHAASLKLNEKNLYLAAGWDYYLKLGKIDSKACTWVSSDQKIATVNKAGKVHTKKKGKAVISCTYEGQVYKCLLTVVEAINIKDFDYDTTAEGYKDSFKGTNSLEIASIVYKSYPGNKRLWDYGDYCSYNLRGLSVGASKKAVEKKYGKCDAFVDKKTDKDEWLYVTEDFLYKNAAFIDKASYVWEYNNVIKYEGNDYYVLKILYFDDDDKLMGSISYIVMDEYKNWE